MILALMIAAAAPPATAGKPLPLADREIIKRAVGDKLKDGGSARYRWPLFRKFGLYCGFVNAKNSYGAYIGFSPFMVIGGPATGPKGDGRFLVGDVTISTADRDSLDYGVVEKMCGNAGFDVATPPPE